ncbi:hypothetical protein Tco_0652935 [Tanacetum coccineum]|uniref:Uncharacterized protein n=1 Tax=Tanacetum coccineum TaxID=301880 RepID=A0ABQ4WYX3_9ASTR
MALMAFSDSEVRLGLVVVSYKDDDETLLGNNKECLNVYSAVHSILMLLELKYILNAASIYLMLSRMVNAASVLCATWYGRTVHNFDMSHDHLLPIIRGGCSKLLATFSVAKISLGLLDRLESNLYPLIIQSSISGDFSCFNPCVGLFHQTLVSGWKEGISVHLEDILDPANKGGHIPCRDSTKGPLDESDGARVVLQCIDYTLSKIIENGNAPIVTKNVDGKESVIPPISIEEKRYLRTDLGGNTAIKKTQKNLLKQQYKNFAASSTEVIEQTYERLQKLISQLEMHGEVIPQEDINQKFLRSLSQEWTMHTIVWRNKPEIETLSLDDLFNNLKAYE